MPTLNDLLKAEGVVLSAEALSKLPTLIEASDEVRGLAQAKKELLEWKDENKDKVTGFDEINLKYQDELNERERLAVENKDYETQIKVRDEREADNKKKSDLRNKQTLDATIESELANASLVFNDQLIGKSLARDIVKVSISESGEITKKYSLNGVDFDSFDDVKVEMLKQTSYAKHMKGSESSGAGGNGGNGQSGTKKPHEMNSSERIEFKKNDPEGFKRAFNL